MKEGTKTYRAAASELLEQHLTTADFSPHDETFGPTVEFSGRLDEEDDEMGFSGDYEVINAFIRSAGHLHDDEQSVNSVDGPSGEARGQALVSGFDQGRPFESQIVAKDDEEASSPVAHDQALGEPFVSWEGAEDAQEVADPVADDQEHGGPLKVEGALDGEGEFESLVDSQEEEEPYSSAATLEDYERVFGSAGSSRLDDDSIRSDNESQVDDDGIDRGDEIPAEADGNAGRVFERLPGMKNLNPSARNTMLKLSGALSKVLGTLQGRGLKFMDTARERVRIFRLVGVVGLSIAAIGLAGLVGLKWTPPQSASPQSAPAPPAPGPLPVASSDSLEGDTARSEVPASILLEELSKKLGAMSAEIEALRDSRGPKEISEYREIFAGLIAEQESKERVEETSVGSEVGLMNPELEEFRSLLANLDKRLLSLEQTRNAPGDTANGEQPSRADRGGGAGMDSQAVTAPAGVPDRLQIPLCGPEGWAAVNRLGTLRLAAHESDQGERWVRVIGANWRGDLSNGARIPVGIAGEARVWVDEAGVFGVVAFDGQQGCLIDWGSTAEGNPKRTGPPPRWRSGRSRR